MSGHDRKRGYDPSQPSTSSGYRRKPYDRTPEPSVRGIAKSIKREYQDEEPSTSTSTALVKQEPMEVQPSQVKREDDASSTQTAPRGRRRVEDIFVTRPSNLVTKKGTSGRKIMLRSNHFKLFTQSKWHLYKYRVDFEPDEERTFVRKGMLRMHRSGIGPHIFDGTVLYTPTYIADNLEYITKRQSDDASVKITICLVGELSPDDPYYNVFFNIIMRKCLEHLKLQLVGRDYYDARNKSSVEGFRLQVWPGYITSIRQYESDILLCAEITHKVLREETLLHILENCLYSGGDFKAKFCNSVIGITVITEYNNHTYRIEDVDFSTNPSSTFPKKRGEETVMISYQEYYFTKYKIRISNATQPMLITRTKQKQRNADQGDLVCLVPELCRPTGLTDEMRDNFGLMKALSRFTCLSPDSRIDRLMRFNDRLRQEPNVVQEFKDWNLTLDRSLLQVPARVLPSEKLLFRGREIASGRGEWGREMQSAKLWDCKVLKHWVLIASQRDRGGVETFINNFMKVSRGISFSVTYPELCRPLRDDKASTYTEELENILSKCTPDLIFCVVGNNRSDRYAAIKKKCCLDRAVPSQVFLAKNLAGRNAMSIATKVAIQMSCKLGGAAWTTEYPVKGLMVIGFDVCHDSNTKGRDYLAMVATVDQTLTRYFSSVALYNSHEDLGDQLCQSVCKAIMAYRNHNKSLPMHIFIYRDGVSEGQIRQVFENEVKSLNKKLEQLYYGPNYKMMFIIVTKKINVRLFEDRRNPPIGTIVDDVITSQFKYDFFLVSQQVRQGTIAPTSYNVIYDNTGLTAETVQIVTYKLTHVYYNCSSTVRVPAPCHYAKKLSFLVGRVLHRPPNTQLENQLFFL